ncbi:MAG: exoribonuclease-2 [Bermanella sp.]|jgi:exoribonuclease-2
MLILTGLAMNFAKHNLVLYKQAPALIEELGAKISIHLENGKKVNVREKDIQFLHQGPLKSFSQLHPAPEGSVEDAWELLQGETVTLNDVADLIYGETTPASVWHSWLTLNEDTYFTGSIDEVVTRAALDVQAILSKQREKEQEITSWQDYLQRVRDNQILPNDFSSLSDVERMAYGKATVSRTLKALDLEAIPEQAHKLLLKLGLWTETVNPYPARFGCATTEPDLAVPELQEEPREDLTALETFAIDDDNCSDPDDAISLDGKTIWVHVADAAALIKPDSPLDQEARSRGANLYIPEQVVHMLPVGVTTILGLGLTEISPALSFQIGVGEDASISCLKIIPSWVRVQRLSYSQANDQLDSFSELLALTDLFRTRRLLQGAAQIDLPEVKIQTTINGDIYHLGAPQKLNVEKPTQCTMEIKDLPSLRSREMVTDAMLMAGEAVGRYLIEHEIPAPFVSQPPPDEGATPETMSQMFAYRKKFKRSGLHLEPGMHSGLGLEPYTRVTSPLRRYSDLLVHQQLRAFISGTPLISEADMLGRMAEAEQGGGNTSRAERLSNRHWTLLHMQQNPDRVYRGVVVDKRSDRGVVMLPELAIEVKMRGIGDYELDQEVELKLGSINLAELEFSCRIV